MFTLRIETDNAAFYDDAGKKAPLHEVARILREVANEVESDCNSFGRKVSFRDINGNAVGEWRITNR